MGWKGYDRVARQLIMNIWVATRRAPKKESLGNPGRLLRGGSIRTGPWHVPDRQTRGMAPPVEEAALTR